MDDLIAAVREIFRVRDLTKAELARACERDTELWQALYANRAEDRRRINAPWP